MGDRRFRGRGGYQGIRNHGRQEIQRKRRIPRDPESWETGDSEEEEDAQWRQVTTLYTRILKTLGGSA